MAKKIHIPLSREQWEELQMLKKKLYGGEYETYESYLEREKQKPLMALFG